MGAECWCYFPVNYAGVDVCGYQTGYDGDYYSIALHSTYSPEEIIRGLGQKPGRTNCKKDSKLKIFADCTGDTATNMCYDDGCTGTSLTNTGYSNQERWARNPITTLNEGYRGGIVRCVNMEGKNNTNNVFKDTLNSSLCFCRILNISTFARLYYQRC